MDQPTVIAQHLSTGRTESRKVRVLGVDVSERIVERSALRELIREASVTERRPRVLAVAVAFIKPGRA
jgi:hypothetical protein